MEPLINNNQLCKSHSHLAGNAENHTHHRLFDKSVAEPLSSSYSPSNFSLRPPFPPPAFSVQLPNLPGVPHGPPYHMDVFCLLSCFHRQWLERSQWRSVPRRSPYAVTINQETDKHLRLLKVKLRVLRSIYCQYSVFFCTGLFTRLCFRQATCAAGDFNLTAMGIRSAATLIPSGRIHH